MEKKIEEILKKHVEDWSVAIPEAMSEYAQLESIEFAEWIDKSTWTQSGGIWIDISEKNKLGKTTSELYQIFKQEQQTTK